MNQPPIIFQPDELKMISIQKDWTPEDILSQQGIFFLKDVVKILKIEPKKVKQKVSEIRARNESPWQVLGIRKIWNHWIVRIKLFAPFYLENLVSKVRSIHENWDGNTLLEQKGIFLLVEVCTVIPFSTYQLRYQANQNPRAREEYGIWKDATLNAFLVDMELFAPWIKRLWAGEYRGGKD